MEIYDFLEKINYIVTFFEKIIDKIIYFYYLILMKYSEFVRFNDLRDFYIKVSAKCIIRISGF